MYDDTLQTGSTSVILPVTLRSSTTGMGATGIAHSSLTAYYSVDGGAATAITLASGTVGDSYSSGKWAQISSANSPGDYALHVPNAAFSSGTRVKISLQGTGVIDKKIDVKLVAVNVASATFGTALATAAAQTTLQSSLDAVDDFLDTEIAAIKAKTDNLPSDPADASDIASAVSTLSTAVGVIDDFLDTEIAAIKAKTDNLPSDPADASDITSAFTTLSSAVAAIDDFLDTEIAAIKAKTDNLPADPADASDITTSLSGIGASIASVLDYIDTEVAAIKAKTDNLPSDPADASDITTSFASVTSSLAALAAYVDTEVAAIKAVTDKLNTAVELDGAEYRFTTNALEQAPTGGGGGGSADWTADQKAAIITILGIPASGTTPEVPAAGALKVIDDLIDSEIGAIKSVTDKLDTTLEVDGSNYRFTEDALSQVPPSEAEIDEAAVAAAVATAVDAAITAAHGSGSYEPITLDTDALVTGTADAVANRVLTNPAAPLANNEQGEVRVSGGSVDNAGSVDAPNTGDGDVPVNHDFDLDDTGAADQLQVVDVDEIGIDNALIRAYLKTEYNSGIRRQRAWTKTRADGRWAYDLNLNAGLAYILTFAKDGEYVGENVEITPE